MASREIWVGESANLSSLRAGIEANAVDIAVKQLIESSSIHEEVLCQIESVQVSFVNDTSPFDGDDDQNDDGDCYDQDNNKDNNTCNSLWSEMIANSKQQSIEGLLIVTSLRIIFCSTEHMKYDFSIDAGCINLHALSNEPYASVFVQVENGDGNCNGGNEDDDQPVVVDITLIPLIDESQCQTIFDALSKLVALHPILPDDDDYEEDEDDNNGDELMMMMPVSMPQQSSWEEDGGHSASEEERDAMLRRLDNLLIVPPELEVDTDDNDDGQFEDADELDDDDADDDIL